MGDTLTNEEKKRLSNERQRAVRNAWKEEKERVKSGQGTRDWSPAQQKELIQRGAVSGYEGHHMKSVSLYPEYAGDSKNIQFLSEEEHFEAHQGNYHNATNGYYDPETQTMNEFNGDELIPTQASELSELYVEEHDSSINQVREAYVLDETIDETTGSAEEINAAKETFTENLSSSTEVEVAGSSESASEGHGIGR